MLVPLALAGAHQADNARYLEAQGAAAVLDEEEAAPRALAAILARLFGDVDVLRQMAAAARALARPGAAAAIADRVEALAEVRR